MDLSTTIACLQGAHAVLAHWAGPHWLLNDEDARNYANAVNNVARHYDVAVAQKTIDIANLIGLACFIEGTRLLYSRSPAARQASQAPQARPAGQVVPIFRFENPYPPAPAPAPPATLPDELNPPQAPEGPVH